MRWMIPLLLCAQIVAATTTNLINAPLGGSGNIYNDARGYSFTTKINPLKVTRLGVRAEGGSGAVGIWREDGTLVASHSTSFQTNEGGYFWATLAQPVILQPYTTYRIASTATSIMVRFRQISEPSVSSAVVVNGIVNSGAAFSFPSNGPYFDYVANTEYTMLVGPNFSFEILPYDTTPPVITLNGPNPQTVYRGTAFTDLGATVTDDFDATRTITGSGTVGTSTVGSYTLTYSAQDEVGNVATPVTRTVNVVLNPTGDEDNDGLNNTEEANLGTNPYLRDTDIDGVNDLREVGDATDPLDPASFDPLNLGLVAYYPLDGNASDASGNGFHGTNYGGIANDDRNGTADSSLHFNGVDAYAEYPKYGVSGARTVSGWVKLDESQQKEAVILGQMHITGAPPHERWHFTTDRLSFVVFYHQKDYVDNGIWGLITSAAGSRWRQYVAVMDPNSPDALKVTLYVDGKEIGKVSNRVPEELDAPYQSMRLLGGDSAADVYCYQGSLDDLRIYNRALNADEVALLFAKEKYSGAGLEGAASKSPFDPATAVNWSSGGTAWAVDTAITHDSVDSVKAKTTDGQSTYREYTVTGPAVVDFWWKVSSEQLYDTFSYSVNGVNQQTISGEVDWTYRTLTLPAGTHTIRWTYTKDGSDAVGQDAGWLDDFAVYPATATLQVRDGATVLSGTPTVDFGSADLGSAGFTKTLTFANNGYVPLEVQLSLPQGSPFTFDGGATTYDLLVGRGESVGVPITLSTSVRGTKTAQLTISAPDSTTTPPQITLTGDVLGPVIGVAAGGSPVTSGQSISMGLAPRTLQFTISNTGNVGNLEIAQISATGNFQIAQQPQTSIAPQGSTTFTVLALGGTSGVQSGTVTITSNDTLSETFTINLSSKSLFGIGNGIAADSVATSGTGGAVGWDFATTQLPSGQSGQALKTGTTPNNGGSVLEFTAQTAGALSWSWKVGSQENFDWLLCEVDGQEVAGISTKNGVWQTQVVNVPAGANVRWVYRKDASASVGEDAGYLADVEFRSFAANQPFSQWADTHGIYNPQQRLPKSGMKAKFAWLGGFDPAASLTAGHHVPIMEGGRLKYRFPISKTADGTQQILFSADMSSWTPRRFSQRVVSEDADRMVIEATAPSGTKGFFKVVGSGDTSMVWVEGGTLPQTSELAGTAVATFQIGRTEVTWGEWQEVRAWAVTNGYADLVGIGSGSGPDHPVQSVNWYDVVKWCNAKSEKEGLAPCYQAGGATYRTGESSPTVNSGANGYRLPTEAEWELAARGGVNSHGYTYSGSNDLNAVAWYWDNSSDGTKAVGTKTSNELGLYDMSGNVWEWCEDITNGSYRRLRGGGRFAGANDCAVVNRGYHSPVPVQRNSDIGFRLARNAD